MTQTQTTLVGSKPLSAKHGQILWTENLLVQKTGTSGPKTNTGGPKTGDPKTSDPKSTRSEPKTSRSCLKN